jgi:hypothetical protein
VNECETNAEENKTLKNNKAKPSINKIFKDKIKKKYNKKELKVNSNKKNKDQL